VQRILTGAELPAGADTVLIQEDARIGEHGSIAPIAIAEPGANIRRRGSDLAHGDRALEAGSELGGGELALLAALDHAKVSVHRRPRVAIVTTGDELRELGEPARAGSIVNSNAVLLAAQVRSAGAEPVVLPRAADSVEAIARTLEAALACDAVVTAGGVSVGDHDHVAAACARAGIEPRFWKVAVKPGKPLLFGLHGRVPVVGLPGNPVSAFVTFELFVRPGLAHMRGHRRPYPALVRVILDEDRRCPTARTELARARLRQDESGAFHASLHRLQGSGSLPSMAEIDAFVVLPAGGAPIVRGQTVHALMLCAGPSHASPRFE
jgi:molybdopterin molybdotransferase